MTTFKVPTNVQREDTIIGPITMKQLIICSIGGAATYALYTTLASKYFIEVWLVPVALMAILTATFAFVKVHGLEFYRYLLYLAEYLLLPRKRVFVKGAGDVFSFELTTTHESKKAVKEDVKQKKSIDELVKIMENKGMVKKPQV